MCAVDRMAWTRSFVFFFWIIICVATTTSWQQNVREMETLIEEFIENVTTYTYPQNSRNWFPEDNSTPLLWGEFDFIVVGIGASGSVLVDRLTRDEKFTVLGLEAGDFETNITDIPAFAALLQHTDFNWGYKSVPQENGCLGMREKRCDYARGKAVGGTTVINYMFYHQGNRDDYDTWSRLGNPQWDYTSIAPFLKSVESVEVFTEARAFHGHDGPIPVRNPRVHTALDDLYMAANFHVGQQVAWDVHPDNQLGFAPKHENVRDGRRVSGGKAFVRPALARSHFRLVTRALVTRIMIHDARAYGVEFLHRGQKYYAIAAKEVVLAAGAINTPQLLMLSGVGPRDHLEQLGIDVVHDLPVGDNLQDHPVNFHTFFATNLTAPTVSFTHALEEYLQHGVGLLTLMGGYSAFSFHERPSKGGGGAGAVHRPDIEHAFAVTQITDATYDFYTNYIGLSDANAHALFDHLKGKLCWTLTTAILHPKSRGRVRLASSDARDFPLIDPRVYSDPTGDDLELMLYTIGQIFELAATPQFQGIGSEYISEPLPACHDYQHLSVDYWRCALKELTTLVYHPSGTCRMGPVEDAGAVVDAQLRVHGIRYLRVADCSVMPTQISGHPAAAAFMIGEKAADMLKETHNSISEYLFGNT